MPPVQTALELYHILSDSDTNLRQPVGLEDQLLQTSMSSEVGQSMLQLLQVPCLLCCSCTLATSYSLSYQVSITVLCYVVSVPALG